MTTAAVRNRYSPEQREMDFVHEHWGWYLTLGVFLTILGMAAIALPLTTTIAVEVILGTLLLIGGIAQIVHSFFTKRWSGFFGELLLGILYLAVGVLLIARPVEGILSLTMILGLYFLAQGILQMVMAFQVSPQPSWGWMLLGGIVSILLGFLIWAYWPFDSAWILGLFVGINIFFAGLSMVMVSLGARSA